MITAEERSIILLEGASADLLAAFQTINALGQERGDLFELDTGVEWNQAQKVLFGANQVISGGGSRASEFPDLPLSLPFIISTGARNGEIVLGMDLAVGNLLHRACVGCLQYVEDWEFETLIGAEKCVIYGLVEALSGLDSVT